MIGIEKSRSTLDEADLVLLVLEADKLLDEDKELIELTKDKKRIIVYNKKELINPTLIRPDQIYISALNKDIRDLEEAITKMFNLEQVDEVSPSLCSAREIGLLNKVKDALLDAKKEALASVSLDLVSIALKEAYDSLKDILGEEVKVDLASEIFSRFCVGK